MNADVSRVLLRAEIAFDDERAVGHTLQLSPDEAFIEIERRPRLDSIVPVRLSFPRLFHAMEHDARVVAHVHGDGPGEPSGIEVRFVFHGAREREQFAAALARCNREIPRAHDDAPYRVLVVDDNDLICDMFVYGVDKYFRGHRAAVCVETAMDGEQAWSKINRSDYDLVIIDHYLPVMDGATLVARVRGEPKLAGLPLVGVSVGGTDVRAAMLEAGADLFLSKPVVLRDLMGTLERLASTGVHC